MENLFSQLQISPVFFFFLLFLVSANQLISEGVIAIIGPRTSTAVKAMYPLCSKFHIPQISASATDPDFFYKFNQYKFLLRMSPTDTRQSLAMRDLIAHFKWERMGILTSATDYGKTNRECMQCMIIDLLSVATKFKECNSVNQ